MNEEKSPLQSKTIWTSVLIAVAGFFPPIQAIVIANPEIASIAVGGLFSISRLFQKKKVTIKKK